ncbi:MAG: 50S ribosomal protein L11 methyltransferase [Thermodesulfovibrionales bacterium]|nr:50S ribosomal protein L11 methyltransferase [Thermodesulfovibrionales bacterium]
MGYYEVRFNIEEIHKELFISLLADTDTLGIHDCESTLICYFEDTISIDKVRNYINKIISKGGALGFKNFRYEYSYISERDWNESWKKKFVPIEIDDTEFAIIPPWLEKKDSKVSIIIDPGMAFGTGHHETTRNCIRLIKKYSELVNKGSFLDLGTGTGVLAICASKLGFINVCGIDNDPLAIDAAKRNILENGIHNINLIQGDISLATGQFDMIVANLLLNVLKENCKLIPSLLCHSGIVLISGLIVGQDGELLPCLQENGLKLLELIKDGNWISLVMTNC